MKIVSTVELSKYALSQSAMSTSDSTSGVSFGCLFVKAMEARGSVWETFLGRFYQIPSELDLELTI